VRNKVNYDRAMKLVCVLTFGVLLGDLVSWIWGFITPGTAIRVILTTVIAFVIGCLLASLVAPRND
jgi:hypothetical protein